MIINWGIKTDSSNNSGTITFPTAFSTTNFAISGNPYDSATNYIFCVNKRNKANFTWATKDGSNASVAKPFTWHAIGY